MTHAATCSFHLPGLHRASVRRHGGAAGPRLLIVPGLNDSGPGHWQTWLESQCKGAVRVRQHNFAEPDLERWSARIAATLDRFPEDTQWIAVAHSFGCLALAHHLARERAAGHFAGALFVAPAEPDKFGVAELLPQRRLPVPSTLLASDTDPWMTAASTRRWAARWGSHWLTLGDAGHVNIESGFGALPFARRWIASVERRLASEKRPQRASVLEWSFAV